LSPPIASKEIARLALTPSPSWLVAPENQEADIRPALDDLVERRYDHFRPVIAAHGIDGNPYHSGMISLFPGWPGYRSGPQNSGFHSPYNWN
jgi:hypothetical protein